MQQLRTKLKDMSPRRGEKKQPLLSIHLNSSVSSTQALAPVNRLCQLLAGSIWSGFLTSDPSPSHRDGTDTASAWDNNRQSQCAEEPGKHPMRTDWLGIGIRMFIAAAESVEADWERCSCCILEDYSLLEKKKGAELLMEEMFQFLHRWSPTFQFTMITGELKAMNCKFMDFSTIQL